MRVGDHVVYLNDPLGRGVGVILEVGANGSLRIEWDYDEARDRPRETINGLYEVMLEAVYYGREPEALTARDFDALRNPTR